MGRGGGPRPSLGAPRGWDETGELGKGGDTVRLPPTCPTRRTRGGHRPEPNGRQMATVASAPAEARRWPFGDQASAWTLGARRQPRRAGRREEGVEGSTRWSRNGN